jgi:hypothetical protein
LVPGAGRPAKNAAGIVIVPSAPPKCSGRVWARAEGTNREKAAMANVAEALELMHPPDAGTEIRVPAPDSES